MQLQGHLDALETDIAGIAAVGDEAAVTAAHRLIQALHSALSLRLLDLLSEAALEVSGQLRNGHIEVRLAGQEPSLVYVEDSPDPSPAQAADDGLSARITLRLPESLKVAVEAAASREGLSVNAYLVRALARATSGHSGRGPGNRLTGFAQS